jgi:hypothetical protein
MIRALHKKALAAAGAAIKRDRYLACSVSDEQLAERAVQAYQAALPARPPRKEATSRGRAR